MYCLGFRALVFLHVWFSRASLPMEGSCVIKGPLLLSISSYPKPKNREDLNHSAPNRYGASRGVACRILKITPGVLALRFRVLGLGAQGLRP